MSILMDRKSMRRRKRGIALITALYILTFVFLLALAFRIFVDQSYLFTNQVVKRTQLYYLAEAGIEYYLSESPTWALGTPPSSPITLELPSGWVYLTVSGNIITSQGKFRTEPGIILNNAATITAILDSSGGNITSWRVTYQ